MNQANALTKFLINLISSTNGVSLEDTLELASSAPARDLSNEDKKAINYFRDCLHLYHKDQINIEQLFAQPVAQSLEFILKHFPIPYREEHTHLTGSLNASFIFPLLQQDLNKENRDTLAAEITKIFPSMQPKIANFGNIELDTIQELLTLKNDELFDRYLQILNLPKLILTSKDRYQQAAYHLAKTMYEDFNVGMLRLKFTLSRAVGFMEHAQPWDQVSAHDVVLGLFEGLMQFKREIPQFHFILSPSFRKEAYFFNQKKYSNKQQDFLSQVHDLLEILDTHPELAPYLTDVDTVGNERDLYRKEHFNEMRLGFRKLKFRGFSLRSHHGEVWHTLKKGVQAVDNAMNIWHIDTLEHGLSLGINPNTYYHRLFQNIMEQNMLKTAIPLQSQFAAELQELDWGHHETIYHKLLQGHELTLSEEKTFIKIKFHQAREVEHYQHDVLNRLLDKGVSLVALPSSNNKLTTCFPDYKDHPFTWWEKKGVQLGIGTDNYVTLNTNYLKELLILLFTDPQHLKITKLLMVATGEYRRPFMSQLLWRMREKYCDK